MYQVTPIAPRTTARYAEHASVMLVATNGNNSAIGVLSHMEGKTSCRHPPTSTFSYNSPPSGDDQVSRNGARPPRLARRRLYAHLGRRVALQGGVGIHPVLKVSTESNIV